MYKFCYYFFFGFGLLLLQKCSTQELDMSGNFVLVGSDQKKYIPLDVFHFLEVKIHFAYTLKVMNLKFTQLLFVKTVIL